MYKHVLINYLRLCPQVLRRRAIKLLPHIETRTRMHANIGERYNNADTSDRCSVRRPISREASVYTVNSLSNDENVLELD